MKTVGASQSAQWTRGFDSARLIGCEDEYNSIWPQKAASLDVRDASSKHRTTDNCSGKQSRAIHSVTVKLGNLYFH